MAIIWTKYWQGSDDGTIVGGIDLKNIQDDLANVQQVGDVLSIPGQAQGDIIYFNGTDWSLLTPGTAGQVLTTQGVGANPTFSDNTAVDLAMTGQATGDILYYDGANWVVIPPGTSGDALTSNGAGAAPTYQSVGSGTELFKANGTFTASGGVTTVYLTMVGGGGAGQSNTSSTGGGLGGGGGSYIINFPYTVIPATNYAVVVGAGGVGATYSGPDGADSTFDSAVTVLGGGGGAASGGTGGGTGLDAVDRVVGGYDRKGGTGGQITGGAGGGTPFGLGAISPTNGGTGVPGIAAAANTGAGGSGSFQNGVRYAGGNGGSGFVLVTY
jgi:hypothetical protein